ncbi:hypothetical protein [Caballeronia sp. KNU42]
MLLKHQAVPASTTNIKALNRTAKTSDRKKTALLGNTMNHRLIETDLAHLEQIINQIASSHGLSLSYWRSRVDSVLSMSLMPAQRKRIGHIDAVISMLEQTASSKTSRFG